MDENNARIVVVDDDITNLKIAGQMLSDRGMHVTALNSGQALLDYLSEDNHPDLILLDILMPDMDGFETVRRIKEIYKDDNEPQIPIVFLTAGEDKEMESKGLELGALDFVRKPFEPEVLIHRINNILSNSRRMKTLSQEASMDRLTGLYNKVSVNNLLEKACIENGGALLIIDLDNFKLVNDMYGHEAGDNILVNFAELLKKHFRATDIVGRIGGDEFVAFLKNTCERDNIINITRRLNEQIKESALTILGKDMKLPLGVSIGAVITPGGLEYSNLFKRADKSLYYVKQNGKHDCAIYKNDDKLVSFDEDMKDLKRINMILNERNVSGHALWLGQEAFSDIYRYMIRYIERYHEKAYKVLFNITPITDDIKESEFSEMMGSLGDALSETLRNSDIMMQNAINQFFLLLPMVADDDIAKVVNRIISKWEQIPCYNRLKITYETEAIVPGRSSSLDRHGEHEPWIVVVDDDITNLKVAGNILSEDGMRVTALNNGKALLDFISEGNHPDLILLDILMPGIDGFDTYKKLRKIERTSDEIPVIFLTAVDDEESESTGLLLGAMDFIKKPFVPEVLTIRVRHIIDLIRLQRDLSAEVNRKTSENEELFLQVTMSLAGAIDAKDTYTNGHSRRVAEYSREIARRYGYSTKDQRDIYMIGLLHDVGKIGVPDEVINKPSRLTDEEFAMIKAHPVMGSQILENIKNMPKLATGARWHHERFGGGGYPDGLKGEEIPEEARIIAVADAYDAMTSNRSYREVLAQEIVRGEIEKGKGTQFDPKFADIMLEMIDEDKGYDMREKKEKPQ